MYVCIYIGTILIYIRAYETRLSALTFFPSFELPHYVIVIVQLGLRTICKFIDYSMLLS